MTEQPTQTSLIYIVLTCGKECKRADQDSGLGRTTDESARTEESSEQEVDSDQRSSGKNFCVNSTNGKGAFSENVGSHLHDRMREASTTCIPMNSIDEELVFLGRLMQSLAVHCRHLVQAKVSCRSGSLRYSPRPEHSADSCDVAYSQGSFKMGHTYNSISVEKEQWLPSMSSSSSSVNRGSGDGISVNQRVPRMGTRGLEHTNNTGETSNLLKNQETIEGQKQDPMNILSKETDTFLQYGGDTAVYPLDLDKQLSLSGQTSAYCTGESVRSQHTTNGVSIRLRQLTKEPSGQFGNSDDNDGADVWNGELTASLSDLGGSILSLAATVSSVPNLFPNNSESIMASHLPCESLSPASNWSIDGSSQSHQRCIATPVSTPVASGRSLNDQQIHSDDSRDGLARIPSISECDSSGINRSRPSGLSNISSSDSLSVTEDKIGDPLRQVQRNRFIAFTGQKHGEHDQTATECYPLKTPLESRERSVHDTRLHIGFGVDAESVRITGQAGSKPVSYRPPADPRSKQRIRPRDGSTHGNKKNNSCVHRQLPPTPPQQVCNEMTSTALQPRQSGYLSSNDQSRVLPSFLSPQINTNHHMNQKPCVISPRIIPSCSHSKISSNPLICVTTTTSCLFENAALSQSNHRYDFYDRFCSPSRIRNSSDSHKFGNDLMKSTKGCAQRDFSSAPTAFSGCGSKAKTEDQVASDIYEIPYASVTLEDTAISYVEGRLPNALGQPVDVNQLCPQSSIRPDQSINRNGHISGAYVSSIVNRCVDCHVPPLTTPSTSDFGQHRSSPRTPCCVPDECPKFPINFRECHQFHGYPPLPYMTENLNVMEWVIKKRPDGTRYITRRPIRNRLLKERAKRVAEERSVLTTDDDVPGDLKTGRQLNRTDRRKQADKDRRDRSKKRTTNPSQSSNVADKHGESQIRPESADIKGSQNITTV
ncbi:unnamed protein product [Dicrocoelium dendriticum]|nr:unnamed protein product [Dicrocoelium dendriticum]